MSFVLSSISGNLISAASAGYAPTNSGDVSAIASAYQVVSATATQLYAGTAYVTSVNGAPLSASRAGNAANASLASSAYYDGTGRLISALPDSDTVSAIASDYAQSAASGKLDYSAVGVDPDMAVVSSIDGAYLSAYIAGSAEYWSDASSKQDTLTFGYDDDKISAINGSALAGQGGGATGDYVEKSASSVAIGTDVSASGVSFAQGSGTLASVGSIAIGWGPRASSNSVALGNLNSAMSGSVAHGYRARAYYSSMAQGEQTHAGYNSFAQGPHTEAYDSSMAQGFFALASGCSFAQGLMATAKASSVALGPWTFASGNSFAGGLGASAINSATVFGTDNLSGDGSGASGAAFVIGDGTASNARHDLMVVTKDGEITMYSGTADTTGTGIMSSIRALSANAGGVDSATVSSIASSYAESAASGKLDASASSSFYTTANESGFLTGVDLSPYQTTADMSGYMSTSMSSDFQQVTGMSSYALSSDVSATVDLVGTQSANWGGSALQLSAGPGVKLEKSGNVLVASTDETVLWSGACLTQGGAAARLSEAASNFDKIEIYALPNPSVGLEYPQCFTYPGNNTMGAYMCPFMTTGLKGKFGYGRWTITDGTSFNLTDAGQTDAYPTLNYDNSYGGVVKVVGINRTAEA